MRFSLRRSFAGLIALLATTLLARAAEAPASAAWDAFTERFIADYFAANPPFAVMQGRHEFDGQLPDWSEAGLQRQIEHLKAQREQALAFPADTLDARQRLERDYLVAVVRRDLFWLETADAPHRNPAFYSDAIDPDVYVSRDYAPLAARADAYIRYAQAVPTALARIRENLRGPLAPPLVEIGRIAIGGLAEFYANDIPAVFAPALTGERAAAFATANAAAIAAVHDFVAWLDERAQHATGDFALGPEKFQAMLRETEGVDISLDELEKIARDDLARNRRALEEACARFAPGKSLREAVALANAHKPDHSVVQVATDQLAELRRFVQEQDLVSIPGPEIALVGEAPAYKRWNSAYINIPGPYDRGLPSVYYVAPPDPSWSKEKQEAYIPSLGS
jgi:hypothetical protein